MDWLLQIAELLHDICCFPPHLYRRNCAIEAIHRYCPMSPPILLVQGDTRPALVTTLTDETTGLPINITGAVPSLKFRAVDALVLTDTLVGTVTDGAKGVCVFQWSALSLAGAPGDYEGEIEIVFSSGQIQTVFHPLNFWMRQQF